MFVKQVIQKRSYYRLYILYESKSLVPQKFYVLAVWCNIVDRLNHSHF